MVVVDFVRQKNFFFVNVDDYQRVKWVQDLFDEEEYQEVEKGLTPKYQRFTMADWAVQSVIFMSKTTRNSPKMRRKCPNPTFNYGSHCRFMSVSYMLW